ncbi:hypothetical protein Tco_0893734 [Tanacetum coccineum]|uniref:Uncharacterized protein n=1 Tax=Tanacetum coccineum TaxID=301880 RepID=A0ABQ5CB85_9ASTR
MISILVTPRVSALAGCDNDDGADRKRKETLVNEGNNGKEKLFEDEDANRKTKKTFINGCNKGKEKLFKDEGMCSNGNKAVVTIYKRATVNGKAKMVEDIGVMKTGRDRGVVIGDDGFKEERKKWLVKGRSKQEKARNKCEGVSANLVSLLFSNIMYLPRY